MNVSFVIPAFNAADTLAQAIESLRSQTRADWQAVVVDDGSIDRTGEIAGAYARRDSRIRSIRQANGGESSARNAGLAAVDSEWVGFLDADDWLSPAFVERMADALAIDPTLDAVHCLSVRVAGDGSLVHDDYLPPVGDLFATLAERVAFPVHACVVRRATVEQVGGFDVTLKTCPDWDLWQRVARTGARFGGVREVLAFYRMRVGSASLDAPQMVRDALEVLRRGHAPDPRVPRPCPAHAAGRPPERQRAQRFYIVCWSAGVLLGGNRDARPLLTSLAEQRYPALSPSAVASCIFEAAILPRCEPLTKWASFWPEIQEHTVAFLSALEQSAGAPDLAHGAQASLEALIERHAAGVVPPAAFALRPAVVGRDTDSAASRTPASPRSAAARGWTLRVEPGSGARLVTVPGDADALRVEIHSVGQGVAHDIQLNRPLLRTEAGRDYRVVFRARADENRTVGVGIARAQPPWDNLGFYQEVSLGPCWKPHDLKFVAMGDSQNARLHFDLGGSAVSVDLCVCELPGEAELSRSDGVASTDVRRTGDGTARPVAPALESGDRQPAGAPPGLHPVSDDWGWDRGLPIDRYYIEEFLTGWAADVRGRVLEIGDDLYTRRLGEAVTRCDILDVRADNPRATVVADLASAPVLAAEAFDCIVLPQTLQYIFELRQAVQTLHRILAPGGVVLTTVPGISAIRHGGSHSPWYWLFTTVSATRLFTETFGPNGVTVAARGNLAAATAFLQGRSVQELDHQQLTHVDPNYEVIIAVRAVKRR